MGICPKCNLQYPDTARFCGKCGGPLFAASTPQQQAPPPQPQQYSAPYPPRPSVFSQLTPGLWVALVGAAVSAVFTVVVWTQTALAMRQAADISGIPDMPMPMPSPTGPVHVVCLFLLAMFVASGFLAYSASVSTGKKRAMKLGVVLILSGMWPVGSLLVLIAGGSILMSVMPATVILLVLGGIAQVVGAFIDLATCP